jgi:hypothetical protein
LTTSENFVAFSNSSASGNKLSAATTAKKNFVI